MLILIQCRANSDPGMTHYYASGQLYLREQSSISIDLDLSQMVGWN